MSEREQKWFTLEVERKSLYQLMPVERAALESGGEFAGWVRFVERQRYAYRVTARMVADSPLALSALENLTSWDWTAER